MLCLPYAGFLVIENDPSSFYYYNFDLLYKEDESEKLTVISTRVNVFTWVCMQCAAVITCFRPVRGNTKHDTTTHRWVCLCTGPHPLPWGAQQPRDATQTFGPPRFGWTYLASLAHKYRHPVGQLKCGECMNDANSKEDLNKHLNFPCHLWIWLYGCGCRCHPITMDD